MCIRDIRDSMARVSRSLATAEFRNRLRNKLRNGRKEGVGMSPNCADEIKATINFPGLARVQKNLSAKFGGLSTVDMWKRPVNKAGKRKGAVAEVKKGTIQAEGKVAKECEEKTKFYDGVVVVRRVRGRSVKVLLISGRKVQEA